MKYIYIGDDNNPPRSIVFYGYAFELNGNAVDVTDAEALSRIKNNPTFKALESVDVAERVEKKEVVEAEPKIRGRQKLKLSANGTN